MQDLYVGAEVVINDFNFALANADEYTLAFMENNRHLFVMADGGAVLTLLRAQLAVRIVLLLVAISFFCRTCLLFGDVPFIHTPSFCHG